MEKYYIDDRDLERIGQAKDWPLGWYLGPLDSGQWLVETDGTNAELEEYINEISVPQSEKRVRSLPDGM